MGNTTLSQTWDNWAANREQDPIASLLGVSSSRDINSVRAVFRTQAGQMLQGNIYQLRSLEYAMTLPHRRSTGQMEAYDFSDMNETQHDRYLQVCDGIDAINARCLDINYGKPFVQKKPDEVADTRELARAAIERIRLRSANPQ